MASDNYYDDGEDGSDTAVADAPKDSGESESATGLLPKSVFMGKDLNVGETLSFKVTGIHDDEVQVQCVYGESDKKDEPVDEEEAVDNPAEEASESELGEATSSEGDGGEMYA